MLLSLRKNGLTSLFKEVRVFKALPLKQKIALRADGLFYSNHPLGRKQCRNKEKRVSVQPF